MVLNTISKPKRNIKPQAKTIILCDSVSGLESRLNKVGGRLRFISLVDTLKSRRVTEYLQNRPDTTELSRPQLFRERRGDYWKRYIQFLGWLNTKNDSPDWWAMTFTAKSPVATPIGLNIFNFLIIVELMGKESSTLLVIAESPELISQTKNWARRSGVKFVSLIKSPSRLRRFLKLRTPSGIIRASFRTCVFWFLTRSLRWHADSRSDSINGDGHLVITSLTHPQSFSSSSSYRDSYFGPLIDHVASSHHRALILGLMEGRPFDQVRTLKSLDCAVPIIPVESCVTLKDIIVCTTRAIIRSVRGLKPREALELDGVDVSYLVNSTVKEGSRSGDFFLNLLMYYCGRSLGKSILVTRCLYPYENRAWEKMFIQGVRSSSPQAQIVGYQHASVAHIQANFFLGSEEADVVPLPDSILTTGNIIQDWLESEGNYPAGIFTTACALRQSQSSKNSPTARRGETKRILVALSSSLAEQINTVVFVEKAFQSTDEYELRVRPHPTFLIESVIREAPLTQKDFFNPSPGSLQDDLEWADVVLYTASTVGLESVSLGVPVVHLDLGEFLDTDPMFGWHEFKWSANEPSQVIELLQKIASLPELEYQDRQKKGKEYAATYLKPVTEDALQLFSCGSVIATTQDERAFEA